MTKSGTGNEEGLLKTMKKLKDKSKHRKKNVRLLKSRLANLEPAQKEAPKGGVGISIIDASVQTSMEVDLMAATVKFSIVKVIPTFKDAPILKTILIMEAAPASGQEKVVKKKRWIRILLRDVFLRY